MCIRDRPSIDFLASLDLPLFKIPSGEITNLPYLERVAACRKPVLLSTGMSEMEEIAAALNALKLGGAGEVTVLHCNTEYPTPAEDANLRALLDIKKRFIAAGEFLHLFLHDVPHRIAGRLLQPEGDLGRGERSADMDVEGAEHTPCAPLGLSLIHIWPLKPPREERPAKIGP